MVIMTCNDDHKTWGGGAADGIEEISGLDDLIKYLRLPSHGMDEEKANH